MSTTRTIARHQVRLPVGATINVDDLLPGSYDDAARTSSYTHVLAAHRLNETTIELVTMTTTETWEAIEDELVVVPSSYEIVNAEEEE